MLVSALLLFLFLNKEPSHQGVRLSAWLVQLRDFHENERKSRFKEIEQAIQAIGIEALPTLVRFLSATDSPTKAKLINFVNGQKLIPAHLRTAAEKHELALLGFQSLGTNAAPAFPQLLKLTRNSDLYVRANALIALSIILPDNAVLKSALLDSVGDSESQVRGAALAILQNHFLEEAEKIGQGGVVVQTNQATANIFATNPPGANK